MISQPWITTLHFGGSGEETRTMNDSLRIQCEEGDDELKFIHNIPSGGSLLLTVIRPILKEHEAACRAASKGFCESSHA